MKKLIIVCMLAAIGAVTMIERSYAAGEGGKGCPLADPSGQGALGCGSAAQNNAPFVPSQNPVQHQGGNWQGGGGNWHHGQNYNGQPNVYFGLNLNSDPGYDPGYYDNGSDPYYDRPSYRPVRPAYSYNRCNDLADSLRDRGYRSVRALDCAGPSYVYRATRSGRPVVVTVSARSGAIRSVARAY